MKGTMNSIEYWMDQYLVITPRRIFDTINGIREVIEENGISKGLDILSFYRKTFFKNEHEHGDKLQSYIVDGKWLLDRTGKVYSIKTSDFVTPEWLKDTVMLPEKFMRIVGIRSYEVEEYL